MGATTSCSWRPTMTALFDAALLEGTRASNVLAGLKVRPLRSDDHGLFDLLAVLTSSPDMGAGAFERRFAELREHKDTYFIIVITDEKDDKRLVATGTVFTEPKFLRGCSKVGHIEDIAVSKEMQGKGLGKVLINILTDLSERVGCYKTILDCDPKNEGFYAKCDFVNKGTCMGKYQAT